MNLREAIVHFNKEATCPVNDNLAPGFVSGAICGWGWARTYIGRLLSKYPDEWPHAIPAEAICLYKDGNAWCAVFGNFINLQESPAGFGDTTEEAIANLKEELEKEAKKQPWVETGDHG